MLYCVCDAYIDNKNIIGCFNLTTRLDFLDDMVMI